MKYLIAVLFIAAVGSIVTGLFLQPDPMAEKFIGVGVAGLFFVVIPLFTYHRWKGRKMSDYVLNQENIQKMRDYNDGKDD
jgi:membrane protein YdbS with pleckstrin-like domain